VVTAARPFVAHWLARRSVGDVRTSPRRLVGLIGFLATAGFVVALAVACAPNRSAAATEPPAPTATYDVDPASLPAVAIDPDVAGLSAALATPAGAQKLAAALAFNLSVEAEALTSRDASLLPAVDHGKRLAYLTATIQHAAGGDIVAPAYDFDTLHLSIVYPGGIQSGPNAGLAATGTVTLLTYSPSGKRVDSKQQPFETLFSLREITPGRWLTTDTPAASKAG